MKIKMLRTDFVLTNRRDIEKFELGKEYEVRDSVGCRLINNDKAKEVRVA